MNTEELIPQGSVPSEAPPVSMPEDDEIEVNAVEKVISEALDGGEREYLLEALEQDELLATIFDNLLLYATEFSGEGPVEGEGTPTSDEIPARLSDGEFVFSAKAVSVIGPDNLMQMMQQAEAQADQVAAQATPTAGHPSLLGPAI